MTILIHSLVASLFSLSVWGFTTRQTAQPCHSGECHWELSNDSGLAMLSVIGSQSSISDLTSASGWTVLDCRDTDIRLVCHDPSKGCDHLYLNGAEHTLVRLPNECGSRPFAFVKHEWNHEDQSIPLEKRSRFSRYDRQTRPVKGVNITTDYSQIDHTRHGRVSLLFRGLRSSTRSGSSVLQSPQDNEDMSFPKFEKHVNESKALDAPHTFEFTETARLYDANFSCPQNGRVPAYSGEVTVDFTTTFNGSVDFGIEFVADLTVGIPPTYKLTHFAAFTNMNATLTSTLDIDATLTGSLSTGQRSLGQIGIPGLDFPPFISVGPTLTLYAEADASINTDVKLTADLAYTFSGAQFVLPPSSNDTDAAVSPGDAAISLSAGANVTAEAQLSVHIVPTLSFGITLLEGIFRTTLNLDLDASATVDLSVTAEADASISESGEHNQTSAEWVGNAEIKAGIAAHASADADFGGIFDKDQVYPLFEKEWSLWSAQFGGGTSKRRAYIDRGDAVMSSYSDQILKKFSKDRGPVLPTLENLSSMSAVQGAQDAHGCLSGGPSGKLAPVLQQTVPGSKAQKIK